MNVSEVRTAALDYASAKRHGRGRSPRRKCRNAKECKVCNGCHASPNADAILIDAWISSLALLHRNAECQPALT
ncbi:hypothetical protein BER93_17210 [Xanthomonas fragariae]|nr:hypothetical protein BER92_17155 [Xanthomonas fragariae]AOD19526.1 hypothetical protein BER93_17210 [Xanthomonas fragariae]ENZ96739.1 hypothetical protein O1K_02951 [Xanthomonas fragariae LMG 25863]